MGEILELETMEASGNGASRAQPALEMASVVSSLQALVEEALHPFVSANSISLLLTTEPIALVNPAVE